MQCSERNKMTHKNDPCSGGHSLSWSEHEKEKDRTYRKVFHQLDIFALWTSIVVLCIIQNTDN